jgi:hypothetical protein
VGKDVLATGVYDGKNSHDCQDQGCDRNRHFIGKLEFARYLLVFCFGQAIPRVRWLPLPPRPRSSG